MDTRDRIIDASAELFRRRGYTGTGMKQIVTSAEAPFGSIYHFFPGGKEQLGTEVIRWSGEMYQDLVMAVWDAAPDVLSAVDAVFSGAAEHLRQTDFADACPIATVALEVASTSEPLREATADVFDRWIAAAGDRFSAAGIAPERARELAYVVLSLLEGAFLFSRSARSAEPVEIAGAAAVAAVEAALSRARRRRPRGAATTGDRDAGPPQSG